MATKKLARGALLLASLGMTTSAFAAQTITANATVKGRIEKGDAKVQKYFRGDTFGYDAKAGEEVWLAWRDISAGLSSKTEVRGPGGFSVADYQSDGRRLRFPQAGRYSILVWSTSFGDYELTIFPLDTSTSPTTLAAGQTVRGSFSAADAPWETTSRKEDRLTYRAAAGETVAFHLEGQQSDLGLVVVGPDGLQRGVGFADAGQVLDVSSALPSAGDYTVKVIGDGGNYTLTASSRLAAAQVPAAPLGLGQAVQLRYSPEGGVNESNAVVDAYKVRAERGQRLAIIRNCACSATVRGPDGKPVQTVVSTEGKSKWYEYFQVSRTEFTAPVAGEFRIEAPVTKDAKPADLAMQVVSAEQGEILMAQARERVRASDAADKAKVDAAVRRGDERLGAGDNQAAIDAYQEALQLDIDNIHANFNAGVAAYRIGGLHSFNTARAYFENVVKLDPNNQAARDNITASIEAQAAFERNSQAAYDQWQRENSQVVTRALSAFVAGVQLGNQINAANAPAPPLPAAAPPLAVQAAAAPTTRASAPAQVADPANIRYGCVARTVVNVKNRNLDQMVNNCGEPLSVGYFYRSGGVGTMQINDRQPHYLDTGEYTRLTICVQGTLKWEGPNIWCGPKPQDLRNQ